MNDYMDIEIPYDKLINRMPKIYEKFIDSMQGKNVNLTPLNKNSIYFLLWLFKRQKQPPVL
jgi:hypothetical protein